MVAPHWWFPFPWFLLTILFVVLLFRFVLFRRGWGGCGGGWDRSLDAESVLKRRLASGQITEEEYRRLLHVIRA
jgi:uncharacterized membrane protein